MYKKRCQGRICQCLPDLVLTCYKRRSFGSKKGGFIPLHSAHFPPLRRPTKKRKRTTSISYEYFLPLRTPPKSHPLSLPHSPSSYLTLLFSQNRSFATMPPKKATEEVKNNVVAFGRVRKNLKMGCVGLPNVGKSSLFNLLTEKSNPAENYPFCTIEPDEARCAVPDERYVRVLFSSSSVLSVVVLIRCKP